MVPPGGREGELVWRLLGGVAGNEAGMMSIIGRRLSQSQVGVCGGWE